ncbi:MAG: M67 family metallopeptidase [Vicinamibacterales bacterium]
MITIVQRVLDDVWAHARAEAPRECCGILVGTSDHVLENVRATNLESGTTRFQIDPADHIRTLREARAKGLEVVGFYHSHPRSRAYPSETDIAESGYADALHLIAGVAEHGHDAKLFRIGRDSVIEIAYAVN